MDHLHLPGHCPVYYYTVLCTAALSKWKVEKMISILRLRSLLIQNLHEPTHGLRDVVGIHRGPPGYIVGADEVLEVEEGLLNLLSPVA
jgi:hypothetical protein